MEQDAFPKGREGVFKLELKASVISGGRSYVNKQDHAISEWVYLIRFLPTLPLRFGVNRNIENISKKENV